MNDAVRFLSIDPDAELGLSMQIRQQLTWLIATRRLSEGDQLPSVRELADHLGINLNTVRAAYKRLEADSLVSTRRGVGTTVLPFDPQHLAESVVKVRTFAIGVVLPDFSSMFYLPFLKGIEETSQVDPSLLFISTSQDDPLRARIVMDQLIAKGVDGLIVASQRYVLESRYLAATSIPPIVYADEPDVSDYVVLLDSEGAGWQATTHLIEHSHERIGLITFPLEWANVNECSLGYQRAIAEAGLEIDPSLTCIAPTFTIDGGFSAAQRLMSMAEPPTAIYAAADVWAMGAIKAIKEHGLQVPDDIAVVGYNDLPLASIIDPPLTTVAAPAHQLGVESMRMLQKLIAGEPVEPKRIRLDTHLVVRRSCGCHMA